MATTKDVKRTPSGKLFIEGKLFLVLTNPKKHLLDLKNQLF